MCIYVYVIVCFGACVCVSCVYVSVGACMRVLKRVCVFLCVLICFCGTMCVLERDCVFLCVCVRFRACMCVL